MYKEFTNANGIRISASETISQLNSCLYELSDLKVKILVPSENEVLDNQYAACYEEKLVKARDLLLDLFYINEKYFFGKLSSYFILQVEKLFHIIDMK
jgi:hypothetical protein